VAGWIGLPLFEMVMLGAGLGYRLEAGFKYTKSERFK
jgi:hypothetical protein